MDVVTAACRAPRHCQSPCTLSAQRNANKPVRGSLLDPPLGASFITWVVLQMLSLELAKTAALPFMDCVLYVTEYTFLP